MRKENEVYDKLMREINAFLTCPKFTVEEHAHNIYTLAWVLNLTDNEVSELMNNAEKEMKQLRSC